jgi:hypothetical protein
MAVPRPVLIAILGMGLVLALLLATRNAGQGGEAEVTPASPVKKPAPAAPAKKEEPASTSTDQSRERPAARRGEKAPAKENGSAEPAQAQPAADSREAEVARAIESDKVVVLLIARPGAADDVAARMAVESLEETHRGRIAVFTDGIQNLPVYQPLLNRVNVAQLPSIVIVRPGRRARLLEGYVDKASLRQHVTDALR